MGSANDVPQYAQLPPSKANIDNLQLKIRDMFSANSPPHQRTSFRSPSRGRIRGGLYSPPLQRGQLPNFTGHRNTASCGQDTSDCCEDITEYALDIVRRLQIPDDERREKEEFCRDLEKIVKRIRPSTVACVYD